MRCKYLYDQYRQCHGEAVEEIVYFNERMNYDIWLCEEHLYCYMKDQGLINE